MSKDPTGPWLGWYGDDFTGATDTLAVAAQAGLSARLFLRVPTAEQLAAAGPLDAVGIAGAARAMSPDEMAAELAPVGPFFAEAGCRVIHYKCCSTFDSAPTVGSIGAAYRALKPHCPNPLVPIVGGQPSLGRYCAFSTLFAAAGQGGEVVRLDRHPTMSRHPVTPMTEPDLRRHLAGQGLTVAALHLPLYADSDDELAAAVRNRLRETPDAVLFDVTEDAHLAQIGLAMRSAAEGGRMLTIGPSSVVQALAGDHARVPGPEPTLSSADSPVFVLVGSLSPVTRAQVAASPSYRHLRIQPESLLSGESGIQEAVESIVGCLEAGDHVMATTATPVDAVGQAATGAVAAATAELARRVLRSGRLRRAALAGGDTSSFATLGLGLDSLSFLSTLSRGVTVCRTHASDQALNGIELALKGGQMGPPDVFEILISGRA